jgi:hypothetical protein
MPPATTLDIEVCVRNTLPVALLLATSHTLSCCYDSASRRRRPSQLRVCAPRAVPHRQQRRMLRCVSSCTGLAPTCSAQHILIIWITNNTAVQALLYMMSAEVIRHVSSSRPLFCILPVSTTSNRRCSQLLTCVCGSFRTTSLVCCIPSTT